MKNLNNINNLENLNWDNISNNINIQEKDKEDKFKPDERFWVITVDENKQGTALIRLLPDADLTPFILVYENVVKAPDASTKSGFRWYINKSLNTIGEKCPVGEFWAKLMNSDLPESKKEARSFSRSTKYFTNIKVIKDPANPKNNGGIFLWKFGQKFYKMFTEALNPDPKQVEEMGVKPKQLFNPMNGNNIFLKSTNMGGFQNFDSSYFQDSSAVYDSVDDAKNDILNKTHNLKKLIDKGEFKSYETLKEEFVRVLKLYKPLFMEKSEFNAIREQYIKEYENSIMNSRVDVKEEVKEIIAEPKESPKKEVKEVIKESKVEEITVENLGNEDDDDLDFLNDLDK